MNEVVRLRRMFTKDILFQREIKDYDQGGKGIEW